MQKPAATFFVRAEERIALVGCNNFYVSCERVFRPDLGHKPVAVLSNNDGCIVARSQEVKDLGIKMGTPVFQIEKLINIRARLLRCFTARGIGQSACHRL